MKIQINLDKLGGSIGPNGWYYGIHFGNRNPSKIVYIKYSEFHRDNCEIVRGIREKFKPILRRLKLKGYFS